MLVHNIIEALLLQIFEYGCESWTIKANTDLSCLLVSIGVEGIKWAFNWLRKGPILSELELEPKFVTDIYQQNYDALCPYWEQMG